VQLATIQALGRFWATEHDWRKTEARLNALAHFTTEIDRVDTGTSAARSYWANARAAALATGHAAAQVTLPVAFTTFPGEIFPAPRSWVEKAYPTSPSAAPRRSARPWPEVAVGDLEEVPGRILEVERAPAAPVMVVDDLDTACLQVLTPPLVLAASRLQARMTRPARAVLGDRAGPLHESLAVKQQQHPRPDAKRDAVIPLRDDGQPEQLAVEAPDNLPHRTVVVEHRLKQSDETWRSHTVEAIRRDRGVTNVEERTPRPLCR
jgi:hypothetical protein